MKKIAVLVLLLSTLGCAKLVNLPKLNQGPVLMITAQTLMQKNIKNCVALSIIDLERDYPCYAELYLRNRTSGEVSCKTGTVAENECFLLDFTPTNDGEYDLIAFAQDKKGNVSSAITYIVNVDENPHTLAAKPTPAITYMNVSGSMAEVGNPIAISASASYSQNSRIFLVFSSEQETKAFSFLTGQNVVYNFTPYTSGKFTIKLTVLNDMFNESESQNLIIEAKEKNQPPVIQVSCPSSCQLYSTLVIKTQVYDPEGKPVQGMISSCYGERMIQGGQTEFFVTQTGVNSFFCFAQDVEGAISSVVTQLVTVVGKPVEAANLQIKPYNATSSLSQGITLTFNVYSKAEYYPVKGQVFNSQGSVIREFKVWNSGDVVESFDSSTAAVMPVTVNLVNNLGSSSQTTFTLLFIAPSTPSLTVSTVVTGIAGTDIELPVQVQNPDGQPVMVSVSAQLSGWQFDQTFAAGSMPKIRCESAGSYTVKLYGIDSGNHRSLEVFCTVLAMPAQPKISVTNVQTLPTVYSNTVEKDVTFQIDDPLNRAWNFRVEVYYSDTPYIGDFNTCNAREVKVAYAFVQPETRFLIVAVSDQTMITYKVQ